MLGYDKERSQQNHQLTVQGAGQHTAAPKLSVKTTQLSMAPQVLCFDSLKQISEKNIEYVRANEVSIGHHDFPMKC